MLLVRVTFKYGCAHCAKQSYVLGTFNYTYKPINSTRCVCETQMPPIMVNSKDGLGHKDKYLDTCTSLVTRNAHVQYKSSNIYYLEVMTNVNLRKKRSNVKVKRFSTNKKVLSQRILM